MGEQPEAHRYIYCVVDMRENDLFSPFVAPGDGRGQVEALRCADIAAVVSPCAPDEDAHQITRGSALGHIQVIERVMQEHTALPVRFGTVAACADLIRERVLVRRYAELRELMERMAGKHEMGVKVFWRDLDAVLREVVAESPDIRRLRDSLAQGSPEGTYYQRIDLGKLVERALALKRDREGEAITRALAALPEDFRVNPARSDRMVLDSSYLVARRLMDEFDDAVSELADRHQERLKVRYVGPVAPFNFVNLVITWDE